MNLLVLLAACLLTAGLWLRFIRSLDRVEPEPVGALLWAGLLGGLGSALVAGFLNLSFLGLSGIELRQHLPLGQALAFSLFVGGNEELCKLLAAMLVAGASRHCDEPADGVVFATVVALGFAAFESLLYGLDRGMGVLLVRSVTSMPVHLGLAALWGYGLARWRFLPPERGGGGVRAVLPWYLLAAALHAAYDTVVFALPAGWGLFGIVFALLAGWGLIAAMQRRMRLLVVQSPFVRAGYCPWCATLNRPGADACQHCATPLGREFYQACPDCRAKLEPDMRFCPRCGARARDRDGRTA